MKLHSKNDYAEAWVGDQRAPWTIHAPYAGDSRVMIATELLKCAVSAGPVSMEIVGSVCDLSQAIHDEWHKRGWMILAPSPGDIDDNPVGFERGK